VEAKGSRTEVLVADFQAKLRSLKDEISSDTTESDVHQVDSAEAEVSGVSSEVVSTGAQTPSVHSEVTRLISEKGVAEERVAKALKYYEVSSIDELSEEAALDFIHQIEKTS